VYREAVSNVNGRKLVKATPVTFSNIFSSFATMNVAVIFVRFYPNRNVSTNFIKILEYGIGLTLLLVDEQTET
jgi:hypothetical protein